MSTTTSTTTTAKTGTTTIKSTFEFPTISLTKIIKRDRDELAILLKACEQVGFWYLDLRGVDEEPTLAVQDVPTLFKAVEEFFELESDEKMKYDVDAIGPCKLNGNAGLAGDGKKYGVEGYTFPRDGLCEHVKDPANPCHLPPLLQQKRASFVNLMDKLHDVGLALLNALDVVMERPGSANTTLTSKHEISKASTTCLTVQRYPSLSAESPHAGLSAHTDVGSLTILFCEDKGLQVLQPDTKQWQYIEPKHGCAVVNVGDSLRFLSNKKFRSAMHRVVSYPGTTIQNRFSCAYFIRPNLDAEFRDEEGKSWKSIDWHMRKYKAYREMGKKA
ncbi:MAG: hypothetical protein Q9187_000511 [Circinaria calcarea]